MKTLCRETTIDARPDRVWDVLTDFGRYPEWNPFIVSITGEAKEGARLRVRLRPPGGRSVSLRPRTTTVVTAQVLEWLGHVAVPGLFDGRHTFELYPSSTGTRFVQREQFRGVLVRLLARSVDRGTAAGFVAMNAALKERVEHLPLGE